MSHARKALLDLVSGKKTDVMPVPQKFVDDFEAVATHYQLLEHGEYEAAKSAARADLDAAISTFSTLAEEIRSGNA